MKYLIIALLAFSTFFYSCNPAQKNKNTTTSQTQINKEVKVGVYYFHAKRKCATCVAVGNGAKLVVEEKFADKNVKFYDISIEDEANKKIVDHFKATGSSLYILSNNKDKETIENFSSTAFNKAMLNPNEYKEELANKIKSKL